MQEQNLSKTYRGRKVFLCAFYSGNLYPTAMRFHREFRELQKALQDKFDIYVYIYNQYNLPDDDRFDKSRLDGTRGYGYWSWKPFIISKTLEKIDEGDILLYIDIGCELRSDGTQRFIEYLDYTIMFVHKPQILCDMNYHKCKLLYVKDGLILQYVNGQSQQYHYY